MDAWHRNRPQSVQRERGREPAGGGHGGKATGQENIEQICAACAVCGKQQGGTSGFKFTALLHHVSVTLLEGSFYALKREAAPGVDGVTWAEYGTGLRERLKEQHSCVHAYFSPQELEAVVKLFALGDRYANIAFSVYYQHGRVALIEISNWRCSNWAKY